MKLPDKIDVGGRPHKTHCDPEIRYIALWPPHTRVKQIEIFCATQAQYDAMIALLAKEATK